MLPPLTPDEMRAMWNAGDAMSEIAAKARVRNGLSKAQVREIVFTANLPAVSRPANAPSAGRAAILSVVPVPHALENDCAAQ